VAQELARNGYTKVYALKGGFDAWVEAGGPVEPK
jgi:rhodanese-related sulfurtransferase